MASAAFIPKTFVLLYASLTLHPGWWVAGLAGAMAVIFVPPITATFWRGVETFGSFWRRVRLVCPHESCHQPIARPVFVCPGCAEEHPALRPTSAAVHVLRCSCGRSLPTHGAARDALPALCPHCLRPLRVVQAETVGLALVGPPSAGKTSLMMATVMGLLKLMPPATLPEERDQRFLAAARRYFADGAAMPKTSEVAANAFSAVVTDLWGSACRVHLYDAAGELYGQVDHLRRESYFETCAGLAFVIDPFSLPAVRAGAGASCGLARAADEPPQQIYDRLVLRLREATGGRKGAARAIAVIVAKADAIPELAMGPAGRGRPKKSGHPEERDVRGWLVRNGAGNLVRSVERDFDQVAFFAVSALGRHAGAGRGAFVPRGVLQPWSWLMAQAGLQLPGGPTPRTGRLAWRRGAVASLALVVLPVVWMADGAAFAAVGPLLFHDAASRGNLPATRALLNRGVPLEATDRSGNTALIKAALNRRPQVVDLLLARGARIDHRNAEGMTAAFIAAERGQPFLIQTLAAKGARLDIADRDGRTPLGMAIERNDLTMVQALLTAGAPLQTAVLDGQPALWPAVAGGFLSIAETLLRHGADPNARDASGRTLLELACTERNAGAVRTLLASGARPESPAGARRTALHIAVEGGDRALASLLMDAGADPTRADAKGRTPLMKAVAGDQATLVEALLRDRALARRPFHDRRAPVVVAIEGGAPAALEVLLAKGADPNAKDTRGNPALVVAASYNRIDMMDRLLRAGARPNGAGRGGATPLHALIEARGNGAHSDDPADPAVDMAARLLAAGTSPWRASGAAGSPLLLAARHGDTPIVRALLAHGRPPLAMAEEARAEARATGAEGALAVLAELAPTPPPPPVDGQALFATHCVSCHADPGTWAANASGEAVQDAILDGFPENGMPAFREALSVAEVDALTTYLTADRE